MFGTENEGNVPEAARNFVMNPMEGASEDLDMVEKEEEGDIESQDRKERDEFKAAYGEKDWTRVIEITEASTKQTSRDGRRMRAAQLYSEQVGRMVDYATMYFEVTKDTLEVSEHEITTI